MLVLRLLLMVLTIICLMDGHAEVSSSTTGIRNGTESPVVKPNEPEVRILDRKKKKKPKKPKKPSKKKKPKPKKPKPAKPVTTTQTMTTSILKTTTILTTPTMETTATPTDSPTTIATTFKTTTSTTSTTTSVTTTITTSTATTTEATSSTATITTATTTIPTTTTTTTAATTADSGAGGECKATNGKPCIFPFKDGKEEYNECKNHGGTYFWCATAVYDSGKYKHWSYCPKDGPCPLEGDEECRTTNNKPCVFPFKDGGKEYNECVDHGGQYFWCATGTNSAGKYTAWSECPKDGSCPLPEKGTTPLMTSTATTAVTTPPTNDTSAAASAIANVENALIEINDTLQNLETAGFSEDEKQLLETMNDLSDYMESGSLTRNWNFYDAVKINSMTKQLYSTTANIKASKQVNPGFKSAHQSADATCSIKVKNAKLSKVNARPGRMFYLHTISRKLAIVPNIPSSSSCCAECKNKAADSELFEYSSNQKQCDCYKTKSGVPTETLSSSFLDSGVCIDEGTCSSTRKINDCLQNTGKGYTKIQLKFKNVITLKKYEAGDIKSDTDCINKCENDSEYKEKCCGYLFDEMTCGSHVCLLLRKAYSSSSSKTTYCHAKCTDGEKLTDDNSCICGPTSCPANSYCVNGICTKECTEEEKLSGPNSCICGPIVPSPPCPAHNYCINGKCTPECKPGEKMSAQPQPCYCGGNKCGREKYCVEKKICLSDLCDINEIITDKKGKDGCGGFSTSPSFDQMCPVHHVFKKSQGCKCGDAGQPCDNNDYFCTYKSHYGYSPCDIANIGRCQCIILNEGCVREDNIYYDGYDITKKTVNGLEECINWCGEETACQYWSFTKSTKTCRLKTSDSGRKTKSKYISGTKKCVKHCPHTNWLEKHVCDENCYAAIGTNLERAFWKALERNHKAVNRENAVNGEKDQTIIFQTLGKQNKQNYRFAADGNCIMTNREEAYQCTELPWNTDQTDNINNLWNGRTEANPSKYCTLLESRGSICEHSLLKNGHFEKCH